MSLTGPQILYQGYESMGWVRSLSCWSGEVAGGVADSNFGAEADSGPRTRLRSDTRASCTSQIAASTFQFWRRRRR